MTNQKYLRLTLAFHAAVREQGRLMKEVPDVKHAQFFFLRCHKCVFNKFFTFAQRFGLDAFEHFELYLESCFFFFFPPELLICIFACLFVLSYFHCLHYKWIFNESRILGPATWVSFTGVVSDGYPQPREWKLQFCGVCIWFPLRKNQSYSYSWEAKRLLWMCMFKYWYTFADKVRSCQKEMKYVLGIWDFFFLNQTILLIDFLFLNQTIKILLIVKNLSIFYRAILSLYHLLFSASKLVD